MWTRVVLLLLVVLFGCGGITFQNDDEVAGSYTLRSVAGRALPSLLSTGPEQLTITSGSLTLEGDGDWSEVMNYSVVESGQVVPKTLVAGGRWTLRSRDVELLGPDGVGFGGVFSSISGPKLELYAFSAERRFWRSTRDEGMSTPPLLARPDTRAHARKRAFAACGSGGCGTAA